MRLDVPDDQVVLFNGGGWSLTLMLSPVFWSEEEYDAFDAELAAMGYGYDARWDAENAGLRARIRQAWGKIFDIEASCGQGSI